MTRQVINERPVEIDTFARLMRAHSVLRRELEAEVLSPRGLTINDQNEWTAAIEALMVSGVALALVQRARAAMRW